MLLGRELEQGKNMERKFEQVKADQSPHARNDQAEKKDHVTWSEQDALQMESLKDGGSWELVWRGLKAIPFLAASNIFL
jgi:hypothetical protein